QPSPDRPSQGIPTGLSAKKSAEAQPQRLGVLDRRRLREITAHQPTPLLKIRRPTKIDGMVLHRFPLHHQPIASRNLNRAMQPHTAAPFGTLEKRYSLFYAGFKGCLATGFDVDLRNLQEHSTPPGSHDLQRIIACFPGGTTIPCRALRLST